MPIYSAPQVITKQIPLTRTQMENLGDGIEVLPALPAGQAYQFVAGNLLYSGTSSPGGITAILIGNSTGVLAACAVNFSAAVKQFTMTQNSPTEASEPIQDPGDAWIFVSADSITPQVGASAVLVLNYLVINYQL